MVRTIVDLYPQQLEALQKLKEQRDVSRNSLIREAIDEYLAKQVVSPSTDAFGIWKDYQIDGLTYQDNLRKEWHD
jgi:predicted transcriptional regulator